MEENREELELTPEQPAEEAVPQETGYKPRPAWQVMGARIGLVIFVILLILYYGIMFFGGGK